MNGIQPLSMFLFEVSCCVFYGEPPQALLLSSPKEVSKKGATVSTRWTPTRERGPLDPARRETCSYRPTGFYPAHPAGRGCRSYRSGKMKSYRANGLQRKGSSLPQLLPDVSPGLQGKAGSSRGWDGLPSIDGGGLGGKTPKSSSTRSKGWRLSWFFFRRRKKNNPPANCRNHQCHQPRKNFLDSSFCERRIPPAGCRKKNSLNPKNPVPFSTLLLKTCQLFPPQTKNPPPARQNQTKKRPPLCRIPGSSSGLFQTVSNIQDQSWLA